MSWFHKLLPCVQVYVLSVPSVGVHGSKTPDYDHYFIRDLVVRLQIGQMNPDGSPLNRCVSTAGRPSRMHVK